MKSSLRTLPLVAPLALLLVASSAWASIVECKVLNHKRVDGIHKIYVDCNGTKGYLDDPAYDDAGNPLPNDALGVSRRMEELGLVIEYDPNDHSPFAQRKFKSVAINVNEKPPLHNASVYPKPDSPRVPQALPAPAVCQYATQAGGIYVHQSAGVYLIDSNKAGACRKNTASDDVCVGWIKCGIADAKFHACRRTGADSCPSADSCIENEKNDAGLSNTTSPMPNQYKVDNSLCVANKVFGSDADAVTVVAVRSNPGGTCPNLFSTPPPKDACVTPKPAARLGVYQAGTPHGSAPAAATKQLPK
jgi:hypothetical protein